MDSPDDLGPGWRKESQTMMSPDYIEEELEKPSAKEKYPFLWRRYQKRSMESRVKVIYGRWRKEGTRLLGQSTNRHTLTHFTHLLF